MTDPLENKIARILKPEAFDDRVSWQVPRAAAIEDARRFIAAVRSVLLDDQPQQHHHYHIPPGYQLVREGDVAIVSPLPPGELAKYDIAVDVNTNAA
jgi:hypothetical protein